MPTTRASWCWSSAAGQECTVAEAASYVFGVTAGNDISERDWHGAICSGSDRRRPTPSGRSSCHRDGLDPNDLLVQTRVNGEVRQSERTRDLIFNVEPS